MILTPHLLLGAAIGSKFSSPATVIILSFASHYLLDFLPHYEYDVSVLKNKNAGLSKKYLWALAKVFLDFLIGTGLALWLIWPAPHKTMAIWGMAAAILPDGLLFLHWLWPKQPILKFLAIFHQAVHCLKNRSPVWLGIMVEVAVIILAIVFLLS
jgi:hypothetical protein